MRIDLLLMVFLALVKACHHHIGLTKGCSIHGEMKSNNSLLYYESFSCQLAHGSTTVVFVNSMASNFLSQTCVALFS